MEADTSAARGKLGTATFEFTVKSTNLPRNDYYTLVVGNRAAGGNGFGLNNEIDIKEREGNLSPFDALIASDIR